MSTKSLLIGISGLKAQQTKMEVIGNNLANVNTKGYKKESVVFQDMFYDQLSAASSGDGKNIGGINGKSVGSGVSVSSINTVFSQGVREETGRYLDFFIEGKDFFVAQNGSTGELMLTRNGNFQLDAGMNLVDTVGNHIVGFNIDQETGQVAATAGKLTLPSGSIQPHATTSIGVSQNIDSSAVENVADTATNAWELFSGGENFGNMKMAITGSSGSRAEYGSSYYQDSTLFQKTDMTLTNTDGRFLSYGNATVGEEGTLSASGMSGLDTLSFGTAQSGFNVGDLVTLSQEVGGEIVQQQLIVSGIGGGSAFTFSHSLSSSFDTTSGSITMSKGGETSDSQASLTDASTLAVSDGTKFSEGQIIVISQSDGSSLTQQTRTVIGVSGNSLLLDSAVSGFTTGTSDVFVQRKENSGFKQGDIVNIVQEDGTSIQQQRVTIASVMGGVVALKGEISGFTEGVNDISMTNLTQGASKLGSSDGKTNNDILSSQVSVVDNYGRLIASFYRVSGSPSAYTQSTVTDVAGNNYFVGSGEFSSWNELVDLMEQAMRDKDLTNNSGSDDFTISTDKFGRTSFSGIGLANSFRIVVNADDEGMLNRFGDLAMTDNGDKALTQARFNENGQVIQGQTTTSLVDQGVGARVSNSTVAWFDAQGIPNYGYSSSNASTEYGEFAGLRLDGGASGSGFGTLRLSLVNALGETVTSDYSMVARDADVSSRQFTSLGDLVKLIQNDLRSDKFSSVAENGSLISDSTATVKLENGRIVVTTTNGSFNALSVKALNNSLNGTSDIARTDEQNFGTILGQLSNGVNGKQGSSNKFIEADAFTQTMIYDSVGNQHTAKTYFVKDRTAGLTNIEFKYKASLNPNLNTFSTDSSSQTAYRDTFNSLQDTLTSRGVLAFDIVTGDVLNSGDTATDARYNNTATLAFTPQQNSIAANNLDVTIDFSKMTAYNGTNTLVSLNEDGFAMGNLVRLVGEEKTGTISGVYSNGVVRALAKIGLMSVTNPDGLTKVGGNYFLQSENSSEGGPKGLDQVFAVSAQAPAGIDSVTSTISSGALEGSNVDLTEELTSMIVAQRSFSAAGKIITSADELLNEALSLKR